MSGKVPPTAELELTALVRRTSTPSAAAIAPDTRPASPRAPGAPRAFAGRSSGRWAPTPPTATSTRSPPATAPPTAPLGTLDLSQIPQLYAAKTPGSTLPPDGPSSTRSRCASARCDGNGLKAEDRRSFNAAPRPELRARLPEADRHRDERRARPTPTSRAATSSTSCSRTYDGDVHALRPNGSEVPGFPVHTRSSRAIDPDEPGELSRRASYQNDAGAAQRARPGQRHRGRRPRPRRPARRRRHHLQRLGLRVGAGRQAAQGLPGPLRSRSFASLPVPDPALRDRPQPPARRGATGRRRCSPTCRGTASSTSSCPPSTATCTRGGRTAARSRAGRSRCSCPGRPRRHRPQRLHPRHKAHLAAGVGDVLGTGKPQVFVPSYECLNTGATHRSWMYGIWPDGNRHAGRPIHAGMAGRA